MYLLICNKWLRNTTKRRFQGQLMLLKLFRWLRTALDSKEREFRAEKPKKIKHKVSYPKYFPCGLRRVRYQLQTMNIPYLSEMIHLNRNDDVYQIVKTALKELAYIHSIKKRRKNDRYKLNLLKTSQKNKKSLLNK